MDQTTIDHLLAISTLAEGSECLDGIAEELLGLHESWRASGAADDSLNWLGGLIGQLGWWSGRMTAAAFPDAGSRVFLTASYGDKSGDQTARPEA